MRTGVAVPRPAAEVSGIAPRRVRDHVAVVAEQWLDDLEDAIVPDCRLGASPAVEHLVTKLVLVFAAALRGILIERVVDLGWIASISSRVSTSRSTV